MSQLSLIEEEQEFFTILPKSGMMRNGKLYQQEMLEQDTLEKECGSLHTPNKFPTPLSRYHQDNYTSLRSRIGTRWEEDGLPKKIFKEEILNFPTICAGNWKDTIGTLKGRIGTPHEENTIARVLFKDEILNFPTPRVADIEGGAVKNVEISEKGSFSRKNKKGVRYGVKLKDAIMYLHKQLPKEEQSKILKDKITEMENLESKPLKSLKMNPDWIEWLMGYPIKWTDIRIEYKDLEIQSYHKSHILLEED